MFFLLIVTERGSSRQAARAVGANRASAGTFPARRIAARETACLIRADSSILSYAGLACSSFSRSPTRLPCWISAHAVVARCPETKPQQARQPLTRPKIPDAQPANDSKRDPYQLKRDGTTVIFSTHDMAIAEQMCDFLFVIYRGKKVLDGTLESIQEVYGSDTVRVRLQGDGIAWDRLPGVEAVRDLGRWQELRLNRQGDTQQLLAALMQQGQVQHFEVSRPSLHDIFVRIARPEGEESHHA